MKRRTVLLSLAASLLLGLFSFAVLVALFLSGLSRVVVTNESGRKIDDLTVEVCRQRLDFGGLRSGESRTRWYRIGNDSGFVVSGTLADGTPVAFEGGYVTSGMFLERADIAIGPDGAVGLDENL